MSIRCVCQNGHVLNVKESLAGTSGLCPSCRVPVQVPRPKRAPCMSEDAILDLMGKQAPSAAGKIERSDSFVATSDSGIYGQTAPKKNCDRCNQEVSVGTHICPHCHTYIANLSDF